MPIGKNALKRVENNGYSKVKSSAPDMENSVVTETSAPAKAEKAVKSATKPASKKAVESVPAPNKSVAKAPVAKKTATKKSAGQPEKVVEKKQTTPRKPRAKKVLAQPAAAVSLGSELPYYLL